MLLDDIKHIAREKGIDPDGKPRWEIIRLIQVKEGYAQCFGDGEFTCKYLDCLWREDCLGRLHKFIIGD